ncbi:hypothetical protein BGW80DRAFT_383296 [Lactifluus volemus]|nr:hypothetical protein BGW80DRAFT_383296 [Lactifluus volemus]
MRRTPPNINTYVRIPWLHNFQFTHNLLFTLLFSKKSTLRVYIFTTVMESSPPSPRSYEFLAETLDILLFRDSQSDPDTLPSPSESHESLLEAVSNNIKSSIPFRGLEPQLFKTYRGFSSFLGRSREELLKLHVSCLEKIEQSVRKLLYWSLGTGFANQWSDFACWVDIAHSFAVILRIKKREVALTEQQEANIALAKKVLGIDCVALPTPASTQWEEPGPVSDNWIRDLYKRNFDPSVNFEHAFSDIQNCHTTDVDREPESRRYDIYH